MNLYKKRYTILADIYEQLMNKVNYDTWAEYIYDIVKNEVPFQTKVLELAGGSGIISFYLQKYFDNYILTDKSFSMLNKAENFPSAIVCCDMQFLPFKEKFGLVVSTFDSVNYLITKKSLTNLFKEIYNILTNEGIFTFDVSLYRNSVPLINERIIESTYKNFKYKQISKFEVENRIHTNLFKVTTPEGSNITEIHRQKIWEFEEYFEVIEKCGLYVKDCFENFTMKKGKPTSKRVQFIVKKSNKNVVIQ